MEDAIENSVNELKEKRKKLVNKFDKMINENKDYDKQQAKELKSEIENINQEIKSMGNLEVVKGEDSTETSKLYSSAENIYQPSKDDISLENYLRAVTDKPKSDKEREVIKNSVTSDGYELPTQVSQQVIDKIRAKNSVISAGAQTVQLDSAETNYITVDSDPEAVWHAELVEENPNSGSFGKVQMKPKTVLTNVEVSRELLQDSNNAGEALSIALTNSLSDAILDVTFNGSGANKPSGMNSLVTQTQTYSGSVTHAEFVKANSTLYTNNVAEEDVSFIYSPSVWETLSLATDDNGRYQDAPSTIRDIQKFTNSGVPTGKAYAGAFENFLYGFRMNITLEQYNSTSAKKFGQLWLAVARMDLAVLRPNAFVRIESA